MGTKRVGLARMEAMIENLKRDLAMGAGTTLVGARKLVKTSTNAAPLTLTALDSGACVVMSGTAHTVTLPAPTAGVEYTITANGTAQYQIHTAGTNVIHGHMIHSGGANTVAIVSVVDAGKVISNATSAKGDTYHLWSDGTNWYLEACVDRAPSAGTH